MFGFSSLLWESNRKNISSLLNLTLMCWVSRPSFCSCLFCWAAIVRYSFVANPPAGCLEESYEKSHAGRGGVANHNKRLRKPVVVKNGGVANPGEGLCKPLFREKGGVANHRKGLHKPVVCEDGGVANAGKGLLKPLFRETCGVANPGLLARKAAPQTRERKGRSFFYGYGGSICPTRPCRFRRCGKCAAAHPTDTPESTRPGGPKKKLLTLWSSHVIGVCGAVVPTDGVSDATRGEDGLRSQICVWMHTGKSRPGHGVDLCMDPAWICVWTPLGYSLQY